MNPSGQEANPTGVVFTRVEVVELILDLVGYTSDQPLWTFRLLEPSCGVGNFLLPALDRLLQSLEHSPLHAKATPSANTDSSTPAETRAWAKLLEPCLRASELDPDHCEQARAQVRTRLEAAGFHPDPARSLAVQWIRCEDFLLTPLEKHFTHVVGNPPYVRIEHLPRPRLQAYRGACQTLRDRADLYFGFIERGIEALEPGGHLGFICPDRWLTSRSGATLRRWMDPKVGLHTAIHLGDLPAFQEKVGTRTGIFLLTAGFRGPTYAQTLTSLEPEALLALRNERSRPIPVQTVRTQADARGEPGSPVVLLPPSRLALLRRLEARWPTLEETGAQVGIGVATGADRLFIGALETLPVEEALKLPLATAKQVRGGQLHWDGTGVISPFDAAGKRVELSAHPKLLAWATRHAEELKARYVARSHPERWFLPIDPIRPSLTRAAKLLVPDIGGKAEVVLDEGLAYPHHNLYYVTAMHWELRALQTVLRSEVALLFVEAYSTRLRGGYLRFQAQVLRRIRLPQWEEVPHAVRNALIQAAQAADRHDPSHPTLREEAVAQLFGLSRLERHTLSRGDVDSPL